MKCLPQKFLKVNKNLEEGKFKTKLKMYQPGVEKMLEKDLNSA